MPHYKCTACKTRFYSAASAGSVLDDLCPECGALLEPVAKLTEIVGFRVGTSQETVADRIGHLVARREVARAQRRVDAERWDDDGGSLIAEEAALPRPGVGS